MIVSESDSDAHSSDQSRHASFSDRGGTPRSGLNKLRELFWGIGTRYSYSHNQKQRPPTSKSFSHKESSKVKARLKTSTSTSRAEKGGASESHSESRSPSVSCPPTDLVFIDRDSKSDAERTADLKRSFTRAEQARQGRKRYRGHTTSLALGESHVTAQKKTDDRWPRRKSTPRDKTKSKQGRQLVNGDPVRQRKRDSPTFRNGLSLQEEKEDRSRLCHDWNSHSERELEPSEIQLPDSVAGSPEFSITDLKTDNGPTLQNQEVGKEPTKRDDFERDATSAHLRETEEKNIHRIERKEYEERDIEQKIDKEEWLTSAGKKKSKKKKNKTGHTTGWTRKAKSKQKP